MEPSRIISGLVSSFSRPRLNFATIICFKDQCFPYYSIGTSLTESESRVYMGTAEQNSITYFNTSISSFTNSTMLNGLNASSANSTNEGVIPASDAEVAPFVRSADIQCVFVIFGLVLAVIVLISCGCLVKALWEGTFRRGRSQYAMGAMPAGAGVAALP